MIHHVFEVRRRGVNDRIHVAVENFRRVAGDFYAPGSVGRAGNFAKIFAGFCGIGVDGADNFQGVFWRIRRAMDAPMGPTPYCTTRIFFLTAAP